MSWQEDFIHVQDLDSFEIAMGRELSLAFVYSTNSYYNSSYDFFFSL